MSALKRLRKAGFISKAVTEEEFRAVLATDLAKVIAAVEAAKASFPDPGNQISREKLRATLTALEE